MDTRLDYWFTERAGTLVTIALGLIVLVGIILGIIGAGASVGTLADTGWGITTVAGLVGILLRTGYGIAMRKRNVRATREIEERLDEMHTLLERMSGENGGGQVRHLPRRRSQSE